MSAPSTLPSFTLPSGLVQKRIRSLLEEESAARVVGKSSPAVGKKRRGVWKRRQESVGLGERPRATPSWSALPALLCWALLVTAATGCGESPEELLMARWQEADWRYEKLDTYDPKQGKWIDGIDFPHYADRREVRHEAEYWEFRPGAELIISKKDGKKVHAHWRLKGRGHVLTVRTDGSQGVEIYDVKELTSDELVLHYDIGMELRGIAKLTFRRVADVPAESARKPLAQYR